MKRNPAALIISLAVFAAWIAWLGSQALQHRNPIVVSRAQLLVSEVDVVARLETLQDARITIDRVLYPATGGPDAGSQIRVVNLAQAKGFQSPGAYVLPLVRQKDDYVIAGLPEDPGFPYDSVLRGQIVRENKVQVEEVMFARFGGPRVGEEIAIKLTDSQRRSFPTAGSYVLALSSEGSSHVLAAPPEPASSSGGFQRLQSLAPRIYPDTAEVQNQLAAIYANKGK